MGNARRGAVALLVAGATLFGSAGMAVAAPQIVTGPDAPLMSRHLVKPQATSVHKVASWLCDLNAVVVGAGANKSLQLLDYTAPEFLGAIAAVAYLHGCDKVFNTNPAIMSGIPWEKKANMYNPYCGKVRFHVPYHARWQNHLSVECIV